MGQRRIEKDEAPVLSSALKVVETLAAYLVYNGTDGTTSADLKTGPGRAAMLKYATEQVENFPEDSEKPGYLDFTAVAELTPLAVGGNTAKRVQNTTATYARLAHTMSDSRFREPLEVISRGCVDKDTERQELDEHGKNMTEGAWETLVDAYNDRSIRFTLVQSQCHSMSF
jgi:hypothetical protein